jgi:hypothetical protein
MRDPRFTAYPPCHTEEEVNVKIGWLARHVDRKQRNARQPTSFLRNNSRES